MRNPFPYYDYFRPRSPVPGYVDWSPGTVPGIDAPLEAWAVFPFDQVTQVLKNHRVFSSRDPGQESSDAPNIILQGDDPPVHRLRRSLISKAFTPGRIARMEPWIRAQMKEVIDGMGRECTIDVTEDLVGELPTRAMLRLLGLRGVGFKQMLAWAHAFMQSSDLTPEERRRLNVDMIEPKLFIEDGDHLAVWGELVFRTKKGGQEFGSDFAHVIELRDGKWLRFRDFFNSALAAKTFASEA